MRIHGRSPLPPKAPKVEVEKPRWTPRNYEPAPHLGHVPGDDNLMPAGLDQVLSRRGKHYYDATADAAARQAYYGSLEANAATMAPDELRAKLQDVVTNPHVPLSYDPDQYLYGWVDLRPNLRLQDVYDPHPVGADEPVRVTHSTDFLFKGEIQGVGKDIKVHKHDPKRTLKDQAKEWVRALQMAPQDALGVAQRIAQIETQKFFNCEHAVPQIWFNKDWVSRGDLHHLFTSDARINNDRSNKRLHDFPAEKGNGFSDYKEFEPAGGRGALARATLYFLVRYPGLVGDKEGEYTAADIETFQRWNREEPPTLWERHRNQAIQELQHNRNPFIDHPEWADRIDFKPLLGHASNAI